MSSPVATRTPFASPHLQLVPADLANAPPAPTRPSPTAVRIAEAEARHQAAERAAYAAARRAEILDERWAAFHVGVACVALTLGLGACAALMFGVAL